MAVSAITRDRYEAPAGRARLLSWLSLAWMTVEGAVAIAAGIVARIDRAGGLRPARAPRT
jgi:hypothetical protein